jgi:pectate lyase-like protein
MVTKRVPILDGTDKVPAALLPVGTVSGTIAAGDDSRIAGVKSYGAVGNGTADDTTAIQAAINALGSSGGTVRLPAGTYKITDAITLRSGLTLVGDSDSATTIQQVTANKNALTGSAISRVTIQNIRLLGTGAGTGSGLSIAKGANPASTYTTLRNVTAESWGQDGIAIENPIVTCLDRVIGLLNGRYGINLFGQVAGAAGTSCSLNSCYGNTNTTAGIRLYNLAYTSLNGCAADHNPIGHLIDTCQGVNLSGCGAEGNTTNGIKINAGYGVTVTSPWIYDNRSVGIYITGNAGTATVIGAVDNSPNGTAVNFIKVDTGSRAALLHCNNATANSLASGTTNTVTDASGGSQFTGYAALLNGGEIDNDLICYVAAKGFVLTDRSNGNRYRLKVTAGTLGVEVAP